MSLLVTMSINGDRLDAIEIINRGPLKGPGQHAAEDTRWYEWRSSSGSGFVLHQHGDGAHVLASKVLAELARAKSYPRGADTR